VCSLSAGRCYAYWQDACRTIVLLFGLTGMLTIPVAAAAGAPTGEAAGLAPAARGRRWGEPPREACIA